jgi:hypothetical protein
MPLAPESALSELEPPPLSDLYALSGPSGSIVDSAADAVVTFATQRAVLAAPVALKLDLGPPQSPGGTGGTAASVDRLEQLEQLGRLAVPGQHDEYIADDQSDAPWASYRPTIGVSVGTTLPRDQFRHRIYEILDDPTYTQALYFLQCEYTKLPVAPFLPVRLDRLHTLKAQILLGVGDW